MSNLFDFSENTEPLAGTESVAPSASENGETVAFINTEAEPRLDQAVSANCEITRSAAVRLIESGCVAVDARVCTKKSAKLSVGAAITVTLPPEKVCEAQPQELPLEIVYEDEDVAVVNKPQGMVVHPAPGNPDGTLVNALLYHMQERLSTINGVIRPGIVHRIDKDTSGLLAVAKNDRAHLALAEQIKAHSFKRLYNAVLIGTFKPPEGRIDLPVGRHPTHRKKMAVTDKNAKPAVTNYRTLETFEGYSLCEFRLETGRTHQIRVHASHLGHPVLGDPLYAPEGGKNKFGLTGQCLHARTLGFVHPTTGIYLEFDSPLPPYFQNVLARLRRV